MAAETPSVLVEVVRGVPRTNTRIMAREYGFSMAEMQEQLLRQRILIGDINFCGGNIDYVEYVSQTGAVKMEVAISRDLFDVMTRSAPNEAAKALRSRFLEAFDLAQRQTVEKQAARLELARCVFRAARQHALDVVPAADRR